MERRLETAQIDIRIGDTLVVRLDKNMTGEVIVNGVSIPNVTRFYFGYDWNQGGPALVQTDINAGHIVATVEHLV